MYQKCDKCKGHGCTWVDISELQCEKCNTTGLIHVKTGKPPEKINGLNPKDMVYFTPKFRGKK